ncbi:hypothetical protein KIW84_053271 [Lathyrus oleraceus]|uniref:Retrovirus-related Pol polyprotein from transposon TNT 1-94-like beta-barrel domain-containing protein n=1 Tax=Pisum sativum TaxID=3888 RepID=A0A9D4WSJ3_PEA|nr:hypothetical protein KIW84_053271 [Pisum sativum]
MANNNNGWSSSSQNYTRSNHGDQPQPEYEGSVLPTRNLDEGRSPSHTWIVDSEASDRMTGESTLFSSYSPCADNQKIKIADDSFSAIAGFELEEDDW